MATISAKFRRYIFRRCRSTLTAEVFNFGPPQTASQKDKKRESSRWTMLPSIDKVEDDGTECLCMKFDFLLFSLSF